MPEFFAEFVAELGAAAVFMAHFGASALSTVVKSYDAADSFLSRWFRRVVDFCALNIGHARPASAIEPPHESVVHGLEVTIERNRTAFEHIRQSFQLEIKALRERVEKLKRVIDEKEKQLQRVLSADTAVEASQPAEQPADNKVVAIPSPKGSRSSNKTRK